MTSICSSAERLKRVEHRGRSMERLICTCDTGVEARESSDSGERERERERHALKPGEIKKREARCSRWLEALCHLPTWVANPSYPSLSEIAPVAHEHFQESVLLSWESH